MHLPDSVSQPCGWAMHSPLELHYHDTEWGMPQTDDRVLFEFLVLEAAQAGLSWITVLQKRDAYKRHYQDFDLQRVAAFDESDISRMLADPGLIRHRGKIESSIATARILLEMQTKHGSFAQWLWQFVDGRPLVGNWEEMKDVPAETELSTQLSKALKKEGVKFFGPTIAYAFMQAVGLVNDHVVTCPRHQICVDAGDSMVF